jgi:hypothetical protein
MAICFELMVNFGQNIVAARRAALTGLGPVTLRAGSHRIALHRALLRTAGSYVELSVVPVAVGWGAGLDGTLQRIRMPAAELTELGNELYRLARQIRWVRRGESRLRSGGVRRPG